MAKLGRPPKYTIDYCLREIKAIEQVLFSDGDEGKIKYFTWHDLVRDKPYSRQRISEWREAFKEHRIFSDTIKKIDSELENRLYKLALMNRVNPTMAIFGLKNNYGWKDRQELTGADGKDLIPPKQMTVREARELLSKIENDC